MRGGAQSHLMRAADGNFYVVKFKNNPQHRRVLANELLATRLAERVGLTVPQPEIVEVAEWLVEHTPELRMQVAGKDMACEAGLQFGARYVGDPLAGHVLDYLPEEQLAGVKNRMQFAGMLALDKWTCNCNGRQAVFSRIGKDRRYTATFIDQGYCFNAGEWTFPDSPLRGVYGRNIVYAGVTSFGSFEPWLSRIEEMEKETIAKTAEDIPPDWGASWAELEQLVEALCKRRERVRELLLAFRDSTRNPFPNWTERTFAAAGAVAPA